MQRGIIHLSAWLAIFALALTQMNAAVDAHPPAPATETPADQTAGEPAPDAEAQRPVGDLIQQLQQAAADEAEAKEKQVERPPLSATVQRLLKDELLDAQQKNDLAIFHGQWQLVQNPSLAQQAAIALAKWELDDPALANQEAPALIRAQAAFHRGELDLVEQLLKDEPTFTAALLRSRALELAGHTPQAITLLTPIRQQLMQRRIEDSAPELTAAAHAVLLLAQLEGRPSQDYHVAMAALAKVRDRIDALYYKAHLLEARALFEKDNFPAAGQAAFEALTLNPNAGETWYLLGQLALNGFAFDRVQQCVTFLRETNPAHPLADLLEARMALQQKDAATAQLKAQQVLKRYPLQREALALSAAAWALAYDQAASQQVFDRFDQLSPGHPMALFEAGKYLSLARQYDVARALLTEAIRRQPNSANSRVELGLLLMQQGDEEAALTELKLASQLDPFNLRANNQHQLAADLQNFEQIVTDHFIIKYRPGVDQVLARDMPEELERIYRDITSVYGHRPENRTLIEIMPDEEWFGVRIVGMPDIWTIAACTGDVIALVPPRQGARQRGQYDWARVIRHEYVHTVTLAMTRNRIPHWFTEACAVSQEPGGRDYPTCQLLAGALYRNELFGLDEINWAFVRPKKPTDRPLAYAQAHWMVQYITEKYGHQAILRMLELYREGVPDREGLQRATGQDAAVFMTDFLAWARQQVGSWGMAPPPEDARVRTMLGSQTIDRAQLDELLTQYPDQPDLLLLRARWAIENAPADEALAAIERYGVARPVDPWTQEALARVLMANGRAREAIPALELLDLGEVSSGARAHQLALLYRESGELDQAGRAIRRALFRDPYNASYRELAATIALQQKRPADALAQLETLPLLEPTRSIHHVRLAALLHQMGEKAAADQAAREALKLDAKAPVQAFLLQQ